MTKLSLIILWVTVFGLHQDKMISTTISEDLKMKIPENFIPMNEYDSRQRVASYRKAEALFTDYQRIVELGINRAFTKWEEGDLVLLKDFYKSSLLQMYDEIEFLNEEMTSVNKKNFAVFEFRSLVKGDPDTPGLYNDIEKYTYIMYTIHKGDTYVFNFTCPYRVHDQWQPIAREIMSSIKLN